MLMKKVFLLSFFFLLSFSLQASRKKNRSIRRTLIENPKSHEEVNSFYLKREGGKLSLKFKLGFVLPTKAIARYYQNPSEIEKENLEVIDYYAQKLKQYKNHREEFLSFFLAREKKKSLSYLFLLGDLETLYRSRASSYYDPDLPYIAEEVEEGKEVWRIQYEIQLQITYKPFLLKELKKKLERVKKSHSIKTQTSVLKLYQKSLYLLRFIDDFTKAHGRTLARLSEEKAHLLKNQPQSCLLLKDALKLYERSTETKTEVLRHHDRLPEEIHKSLEVLPAEFIPLVSFKITKSIPEKEH